MSRVAHIWSNEEGDRNIQLELGANGIVVNVPLDREDLLALQKDIERELASSPD